MYTVILSFIAVVKRCEERGQKVADLHWLDWRRTETWCKRHLAMIFEAFGIPPSERTWWRAGAFQLAAILTLKPRLVRLQAER